MVPISYRLAMVGRAVASRQGAPPCASQVLVEVTRLPALIRRRVSCGLAVRLSIGGGPTNTDRATRAPVARVGRCTTGPTGGRCHIENLALRDRRLPRGRPHNAAGHQPG